MSQSEDRIIRRCIKLARRAGLETAEGQAHIACINKLCRKWGRDEIDITTIPPSQGMAPRTKMVSKPGMRANVWEKSGGKCWYCGIQTVPWRSFCVDHLVPLADGGTDDLTNLVPCCKPCNLLKGDRSVEYLRRRLSGDDYPAFTAKQRIYLNTLGVQLVETPGGYTLYFERESAKTEAGL